MNIDDFLNKPYWIIDILPKQVTQDAAGQYFKVEQYYLEHVDGLRQQYFDLLLKLNCYYDIALSHDGEIWTRNPDPRDMEQWLGACLSINPSQCSLFVMVESENSLMMAERDSTYMTIYQPSEALQDLLHRLATAAGLFLWKGFSK